jgi:hypothetical protein
MHNTYMPRVPLRYVPTHLSRRDKKTVKKELKLSRKLYKKTRYHTRKKVKSFHSKPSNHIVTAKKVYGLDKIIPSPILAKKTGCSLDALKHIVKKGEGAYFSSGSRPNQTAQSWGYARLASSITGGKASAVDYTILEKGCSKNSKALRLAKKSMYYKTHGSHSVPRIKL